MYIYLYTHLYHTYYSRWITYSNPATRTMLNPRTPKSQCFSVRVTKSDVRGLILYDALQVTLTLNFGGDAVVPDTRGLNILSIYGSIYVYIYIIYIYNIYIYKYIHIILTIRQLVILYFQS